MTHVSTLFGSPSPLCLADCLSPPPHLSLKSLSPSSDTSSLSRRPRTHRAITHPTLGNDPRVAQAPPLQEAVGLLRGILCIFGSVCSPRSLALWACAPRTLPRPAPPYSRECVVRWRFGSGHGLGEPGVEEIEREDRIAGKGAPLLRGKPRMHLLGEKKKRTCWGRRVDLAREQRRCFL